jgi:hypothetical protein
LDVTVDSSQGRVIRASTPPRKGPVAEDREVLWMLSREGAPPARAELVAYTDAVELETFSGSAFRRRWRFLRDTAARQYAARVKRRLIARGFVDRRGDGRPGVWLV